MTDALEYIEQHLLAKDKECLAAESLTTFPKCFFKNMKTTNIGFIVCKRGSFTFIVEDDSYLASADETFIFPNDKTFHIVSHTPNLEIAFLYFHTDVIRDNLGTTISSMHIYTKLYTQDFKCNHTGQEKELIHYIALLEHTYPNANTPYSEYEWKLQLMSVTYRLCNIFQQQAEMGNTRRARSTEVFLKLIKLIDENYMKHRGVEFYADELCLTPKYLSQLCKSVSGRTVQGLVFKAIIRKTKILLTTTNMNIQEISNELNFANSSSFGTFFKKMTGLAPQHYRNEEKRKSDEEKTRTAEGELRSAEERLRTAEEETAEHLS